MISLTAALCAAAPAAYGETWHDLRTFSLPDLTESNQVRMVATLAGLAGSDVLAAATTLELGGSYTPRADITIFGVVPMLWGIANERTALGNITAGGRWGFSPAQARDIPVRLAVGGSISLGTATSQDIAPQGGLVQAGQEPDRYYHKTTTVRVQADALWWSRLGFAQLHAGFHRATYPGTPDPQRTLKMSYSAFRLAVAGGFHIGSLRILGEISRLYPIAPCSALPDDIPCMPQYGDHLDGRHATVGVRYDRKLSVGLAVSAFDTKNGDYEVGASVILDISRHF